MPIQVSCSCGKSFSARDELAGKRVRCPGCQQPLEIPAQDDYLLAGGLGDLLEEGGLSSGGGTRCPSCRAEMPPNAVICVHCGFNQYLGRKMETMVGADMDAPIGAAPMTEGERMLAKAEREIAESPIQQSDSQYGDGGESYLVMLGMLLGSIVVLGLSGLFLYFFDKYFAAKFDAGTLAFFAGLFMYTVGAIWLIVLAFIEDAVKGFCCMFVPFYILYYAFTRFGDAKLPASMFFMGWVACMIAQVAIALTGT